MLIIGEKINIRSIAIGGAMKNRETKPIQELAVQQVEGGAGMLDVNIGPGTKGGVEMMEWLVKIIQEVVDVPLSLDTTSAVAMEAGLKVHKGQALINSASGDPERLHAMMPLAKTYGSNIIGLALTEKGIPRDADERCVVAADIMGAMVEYDVPFDRLYLDPLILPVSVAQEQALEVIKAVEMFKQLNDPPLKTVVGLSNIYNQSPPQVQGIIIRTYLVMLMEAGLDAAIADSLDNELMDTIKAAETSLTLEEYTNRLEGKELEDTIKTIKILRGENLYAHSYLD